jgi:hypothetical protein
MVPSPSEVSMPPSSEVIGVISDTHLNGPRPELIAALARHLGGCQRLVHCGDVTDASVLAALAQRWEVLAVRGNMDPDLGVPRQRVFEVGGVRIAVQHGSGAPDGIEARLLAGLGTREPRPDVFLYGHTHAAVDRVVEGVRFLNPGSPTDQRWAPFRSVGRLIVTAGAVRFEILRVAGEQ